MGSRFISPPEVFFLYLWQIFKTKPEDYLCKSCRSQPWPVGLPARGHMPIYVCIYILKNNPQILLWRFCNILQKKAS